MVWEPTGWILIRSWEQVFGALFAFTSNLFSLYSLVPLKVSYEHRPTMYRYLPWQADKVTVKCKPVARERLTSFRRVPGFYCSWIYCSETFQLSTWLWCKPESINGIWTNVIMTWWSTSSIGSCMHSNLPRLSIWFQVGEIYAKVGLLGLQSGSLIRATVDLATDCPMPKLWLKQPLAWLQRHGVGTSTAAWTVQSPWRGHGEILVVNGTK